MTSTLVETGVKVKVSKLDSIPELQSIECHWSASNAKTSVIFDQGREGEYLETSQDSGKNLNDDLDGSSTYVLNMVEEAVTVPIGPGQPQQKATNEGGKKQTRKDNRLCSERGFGI
ncbi:MAG: hypothetical protein Q9175_004675 [Cornicularia normoerica]